MASQAVDGQKSDSLEEVGLESQREGEERKDGGSGAGEYGEPRGATAAAPAPTITQPPYDEDFNPFSEEGIGLMSLHHR